MAGDPTRPTSCRLLHSHQCHQSQAFRAVRPEPPHPAGEAGSGRVRAQPAGRGQEKTLQWRPQGSGQGTLSLGPQPCGNLPAWLCGPGGSPGPVTDTSHEASALLWGLHSWGVASGSREQRVWVLSLPLEDLSRSGLHTWQVAVQPCLGLAQLAGRLLLPDAVASGELTPQGGAHEATALSRLQPAGPPGLHSWPSQTGPEVGSAHTCALLLPPSSCPCLDGQW